MPSYESIEIDDIVKMREVNSELITRLRHYAIDTRALDNIKEGSKIERAFYTKNLDIPVRNAIASFRSIRDGAISNFVRNIAISGAGATVVQSQLHGSALANNPALSELSDRAFLLSEQLASLNASNVESSDAILALTAEANALLAQMNNIVASANMSALGFIGLAMLMAASASLASSVFSLTSGIKGLRAKNPLFFAVNLRVLDDKYRKDKSPLAGVKTFVNETLLGN